MFLRYKICSQNCPIGLIICPSCHFKCLTRFETWFETLFETNLGNSNNVEQRLSYVELKMCPITRYVSHNLCRKIC